MLGLIITAVGEGGAVVLKKKMKKKRNQYYLQPVNICCGLALLLLAIELSKMTFDTMTDAIILSKLVVSYSTLKHPRGGGSALCVE